MFEHTPFGGTARGLARLYEITVESFLSNGNKFSRNTLGRIRSDYAVSGRQTINPKDTAMKTTSIQLFNRNPITKSQCSLRPLTAGLMVCVGMAASLANAQTQEIFRWWNPNGSPETGYMNDSSNWEDFILPSTAPVAINRLVFEFANSGDFEAVNNRMEDLSVAAINFSLTHQGIARISGSRLKLRTFHANTKCQVGGGSSVYPLILETPLSGTSGFDLWRGVVVLNPSDREAHTITGGIECSFNTVLAVSESWHLGAVSNSVTVGAGELRFDAPMTVGIPVSASENGTLRTNTSGTVKLLKFNTRGVTHKAGPGTLRVFGAGPDSQGEWRVGRGTLVAESGSVDSSRVDVVSGATLQFAAPASLSAITARGVIDIGDHTVETGYAYIEGSAKLMGNGVLRAVGSGSVNIDNDEFINDFAGVIEADGGKVTFIQSSIDSPMTLRPVHPSDLIEFFYSGHYRVGLLEGAGVINMRSIFGELEFGVGDKDGTFSGTIQSPLLITKVGSGRQDFIGMLDLGGREIVIRDGVVGLSDSAAGGVSKIVVHSNGTFTPIGTVNAPTVEGSGTVQLNSQTLTVGETNLDFALSGTLTGNIETSTLRKRGSGTFTLSADTTGFGGFIQINDGAVRFTGGRILPAAAGLNISNGALHGYGDLDLPFWNQGTIAADSSTGVLRLSGQDQWNNGTILAENGGTLELDGVFLEQDHSGSLIQGRLEGNGSPIRLIGDDPTIVQGGTIETTADGSLELIGTTITLREVDHSGHLTLRSGVDVTAEDFDIVTGAAHTLEVEFDPDVDESDGAIRGHGTATLGGMFRVTLPEDYLPAAGDSMTVIDGDDTGDWTIVESFESIELPDVSPMVMRVESNPDSLRVVVTCEADLAEPYGTLNFFDISTFISLFVSGDPGADFAAPFGTLNFFDVSAFINTFSSGCP